MRRARAFSARVVLRRVCAAVLGAAAFVAGAKAGAPERPAIERVEAIRAALRAIDAELGADHEQAADRDGPPRQAQWYNWPNWGDWGNWNNWRNR